MSQVFRWNLALNLPIILLVPLPLWLPFVAPALVASVILLVINSLLTLIWLLVIALAFRTLLSVYRYKNMQNVKDGCESVDHTSLQLEHVFIMACYKEPLAVISRSVQSIAAQTEVAKVTMVLAFELKTPDLQQKCQQLESQFQVCGFHRFLFTVHRLIPDKEIPGKCSNSNYAMREVTKVLQYELGKDFDPTRILITNCDADTQFSSNYCSALTASYTSQLLQQTEKNTERSSDSVVYQAPLIYNWGLDRLSAVTRVTSLLRSTLMMGALIPFNINVMSVYSHSLKLAMDANYTHPHYQMDDIICVIRWMGISGRRIRIRLIPVPVLSGPTSGLTLWQEISEWARQARRWTIGAAEVFHYYVIKAPKMPLMPAISWGCSFVVYYVIILCTFQLFGVTLIVSFACLSTRVSDAINYELYCTAFCQVLGYASIFIIDKLTSRLMDIKEHINPLRHLLHFVLTPIVCICYSLVELYAFGEVTVRGKKVCKHGASKKTALQIATIA